MPLNSVHTSSQRDSASLLEQKNEIAGDSPPKHQPPDELISELLPDEEESIKDAGAGSFDEAVGAAAAVINESV